MTAKAKKTSARRVIKSSWPRHAALSETARINVPKDNPFREGTERHIVFEKMRKAKTVGKFLEMKSKRDDEGRGRRRAILRSLVHEAVVKVVGGKAA